MVAPEIQAPCCCLQSAGPNLHSPSTPKNLYLLHDAWKHTVFSYNFTWPLTPSAQMQYDLAATIHFGLWSRFNEFLLCCMCMSLGLALSVDPSHHQWVLKIHHLAIQNEHVQPLQDRSLVSQSLNLVEEICTANSTYWVCLFVFFLTLDDNSNWIVTGRFPTILPGKHECRWTFELLSFINLDHMRRFGIVTYKKLACVHTCSFQQIAPILLLFWRLSKIPFRGSPK